MKRAYTLGEKSLFAAPLLFIALGIGAWAWRQKSPIRLDVPSTSNIDINVDNLIFSPDGRRLAVALSQDGMPSNESVFPAQVIDVQTHSKICTLADLPSEKALNSVYSDYGSGSYKLAWSPDSNRLVLTSPYSLKVRATVNAKGAKPRTILNSINQFAIWNAESGEVIGEYPYVTQNETSEADKMWFSADGQRIIGSGEPPSIFDANTGKRLQAFKKGRGYLLAGIINEELQLCAQSRTSDLRVQVFDLKTQKLVWQTKRNTFTTAFADGLWWKDSVLGCRIHPEKNGDVIETLLLWDGKTHQPLPSPPCEDGTDWEFFPDGNTLAYLNWLPTTKQNPDLERELVVWDYRRNQVLWRQTVSNDADKLKASPDSKWLSMLEPSDNNTYSPATLKVYDRTGKLRIEKITSNFTTAWSPDSTRIATVTQKVDELPQIEFVRVGE